MPITSLRGTAGTAATSLLAGPASAAGVKGYDTLVRIPSGGSSVYIGGSAVTTASGFELQAGESLSLNVDPGEELYGIVGASTQVVHVLYSTDDD
jgi:hypothetical protein